MSKILQIAPPDQPQRARALDPARSVLVQAPAGSGKTDLLTRRYLRLLGEVDDPSQIVAITFTKAAAAEMRHRILSELEKAAAAGQLGLFVEEIDMPTLARRALDRSHSLGWNLLELPTQLRISTIDSFCRELALQQPLLSGLGGDLDVTELPGDLYRRAARRTLEQIGAEDAALSPAIEKLLLSRDNGWQEMENLLITMLEKRDRWMQEFWLRDFGANRQPDWDALRQHLERPFVRVIEEALTELDQLFDLAPGARSEAIELARFACEQSENKLYRELAELTDFPVGPFSTANDIDGACEAYGCLADLLLTGSRFRKRFNKNSGFPLDRPSEKQRMRALIARLKTIPSLEKALTSVRRLPLSRYTEDEWQIMRACFTLLRHAVGQLHVVFAEAGRVDFAEVAQQAQRVLTDEEQMPTDAAIAAADGIRHLLVDEFQDTSRRQHRLIASLVAAWPDSSGRTVFVVGDPMQSIYSFRDADAELFPRVRSLGLDLPHGDPHILDFVPLTSNFRTDHDLVITLNDCFAQIFAVDDGSGARFSPSEPARAPRTGSAQPFDLHLDFIRQIRRGSAADPVSIQRKQDTIELRDAARSRQTQQVVALIRSRLPHIARAQRRGEKYRIAVLGRTRNALAPVARALREGAIPFRAVDLESLADRPEVLDALALARALFNAEDRVAWLGVLRAPWCGLSLADLHLLTSADDAVLLDRPVPQLLAERVDLLSDDGRHSVARIRDALAAVPILRATHSTARLGTWLQQVWQRLGGTACVDDAARANLDELWKLLDELPGGEADLLGRALTGALQGLTAQADPAASSDGGVQLMTIHKAKGLEFEVVIVPELQAACARSRGGLLSWLERGLTLPDEFGDITEFLVAPLQPKGEDRGKAKAWVDRVYRERESQETRRILYVAATRAREELHLFGRPTFKEESDGKLSLCEPPDSLLSTAWPAIRDRVQASFEQRKTAPQAARITSIAAAAGNLRQMPSPVKPTILRRLPPEYEPPQGLSPAQSSVDATIVGLGDGELYARHEGGPLSRAVGIAVHSYFEQFAGLLTANTLVAARNLLRQFSPRIAAQIRAIGFDSAQADKIAAQALEITVQASRDTTAAWILSPHYDAASEVRWAGVIGGSLRMIQVDRVFRAGPIPLGEGHDVWWIIDYKTAHAEDMKAADALPRLRPLFAPQLQLYAQVLRNLHGDSVAIRAGLYYPRMFAFDSWDL